MPVAAALPYITAGLSVASFVQGVDDRNKANEAANRARDEQTKIAGEQKASNAAAAMAERRQQVREERIKRARVLQMSSNSGVVGSSGEQGALGVLDTNLDVGIGRNLGSIATAERTGQFAQNAADFIGRADNLRSDAQFQDQIFGISTSMFREAGGTKSIFGSSGSTASTPTTNWSGVDYNQRGDN
jgi:hypothetical protein